MTLLDFYTLDLTTLVIILLIYVMRPPLINHTKVPVPSRIEP